MTSYLVNGSALIPIGFAEQIAVSTDDRYSIQQARTKRWAFVEQPGSKKREWSISMAATESNELANLDAALNGAYGLSPFGLISCDAHGVNLLSPDETMLTGLASGTLTGADGGVYPSILTSTTSTIASKIPVPAGQPFTFSVLVSGDAAIVAGKFYNSLGTQVGATFSAKSVGMLSRVTITGKAQAVNTTVTVTVAGAAAIAAPQATWTDYAVPFHHGRGAKSVVVQNGSTQMLTGWGTSPVQTGDITLVEVG